MNQIAIEDFAKYLAHKNLLPASEFESVSSHHAGADRSLRKLWETTELTANGFADEVANFYGLKRLTLPQLVAATSLAARFSQRFLRDTAVFPFEFPKGHYRLAVADPSDTAAIHAARRNARIRGRANGQFLAGRAEELLPRMLGRMDPRSTTVILDPPRTGCPAPMLQALRQSRPRQILYVSCHPATLARDLNVLCADNVFDVTKIVPLDMFPQTQHMECVADARLNVLSGGNA